VSFHTDSSLKILRTRRVKPLFNGVCTNGRVGHVFNGLCQPAHLLVIINDQYICHK
jgi:hypothetical protein